ncbi:MAG: hypothetical protein M3044_05105 [Thermoproteota archaeon]|jgi:hypothetical protein|nr:hypothetical protein [Thermoproteota archaeon]
MTARTLISIEAFDNTAPENPAYVQTYKIKLCTYCDRIATKRVLYSVSHNIIAQERYCDRCIKRIKK